VTKLVESKAKTFQEILSEKTQEYEIHWKRKEPTEEKYLTLEEANKLEAQRNVAIHLIEILRKELKDTQKEHTDMRLKIVEVNKILFPQLDLLKIDAKYGTYRLVLSYEEIKSLREILK
jgi:hypothetical protein